MTDPREPAEIARAIREMGITGDAVAELTAAVEVMIQGCPAADVCHVVTMTVGDWRRRNSPPEPRVYRPLTADEEMLLHEDMGDFSHMFGN